MAEEKSNYAAQISELETKIANYSKRTENKSEDVLARMKRDLEQLKKGK